MHAMHHLLDKVRCDMSNSVTIVMNPKLCWQQDLLEVDLCSSREKVAERSGEDKTYTKPNMMLQAQ